MLPSVPQTETPLLNFLNPLEYPAYLVPVVVIYLLMVMDAPIPNN